MSLTLKGKVHEIGQTEQVTESFKKRDMIVAYAENPQFVEYIRFESTQDRVNIFDNLAIGDEVEVSFNLRGRPWTNKDGVTTYFNSLVAWRVTKLAKTAQSAKVVSNSASGSNVDEEDNLPF
jgi:hypothetical protein